MKEHANQQSNSGSEASIRRQLDELDQIYKCSPVGLAVIDRDMRIVRINERMAEIVGKSAEEYIGRTLDEVIPNMAEYLKSILLPILEKGEPIQDLEISGTIPNTLGVIRHWLTSYYPLRSDEGEIIGILGAAMEITERKRAEHDLLLTQFAVDHASDAVYWIDENARFVYINDAACESLGYSREELLQMGVGDIDPIFPMDRWREIWEENRAQGFSAFETLHKTKQGRVFPVEIKVNFIEYGGSSLDCAYARDISERKQSEEALRKANRTLATLSCVNEILVRATEEPELLRDVCQAIVEVGGYRMVWVGFAEDDEEKTVRPAAYAGYANGYLDQLKISWGDNELGRGPTGTAIRTGKHSIVCDVHAEPSYLPWREEATKRGYGFSVSFPLTTNGNVIGAINLNRAEPGCLDTAEENLLSQLASDLSYGITSLRMKNERSAAEAERRALEQLLEEHKRRFYRETIQSVTDGKLDICDAADVEPYMLDAQMKIDVVQATEVGQARRKVEAFCRSHGLNDDEIRSMFIIGVGEAISNAIKHGYHGCVYAGKKDDEIWVGVKDSGSGIESLVLPRAVLRRGFSTKPSLGLGYSIMLEVSDRILLNTGIYGTTVVLIKSIHEKVIVPLDTVPDTWVGIPDNVA